MKKLVLSVLVVAVSLAGTAALAACGDEATTVPTGAIAAVGDRVVTRAQLDEALAQYKVQYDLQAGQPGATAFPEEGTAEYDALVAQVVDSLVQGELIRQEARERHLTVSDAELEQAVTEAAAGQGGKAKLDEALAQYGMTDGDLRVALTTSLLANKVGTAVTADAAPTEAEIRAYFDANKDQFGQPESRKTRHILVDDKATAERLYTLLSADPGDANWKKLAEQYTQDTGGRLTGGDLGSVTRGQMVPPFEDAVFSAEQGEVVGPIKTKYGWHVLQVTQITEAVEADYEKSRPEIAQQLASDETQQAWQAWLDEAKSTVTYAPGFDPAELRPASPAPEATIQP
jgi:parvulin-like peptidyl-prolyl isomerase